MASSKRLFTLSSPHGQGGVFLAWQRTSGGYLATTGYDQVKYIKSEESLGSHIFYFIYKFYSLNIQITLLQIF